MKSLFVLNSLALNVARFNVTCEIARRVRRCEKFDSTHTRRSAYYRGARGMALSIVARYTITAFASSRAIRMMETGDGEKRRETS